MARKQRLPGPDGQMHDGVEVGFRSTSGEYWNEYLLDDGTVIRVKVVVIGVVRLDDAYDPEGQPLYAVKSNNIVVVSAAEDLIRREE